MIPLTEHSFYGMICMSAKTITQGFVYSACDQQPIVVLKAPVLSGLPLRCLGGHAGDRWLRSFAFMDTRRCNTCGIEKPLTTEFFYPCKTRRHKSGLETRCIECRRAYSREYVSKHREERRAYQKQYSQENPERTKESTRKSQERHKERRRLARKSRRELNLETEREKDRRWDQKNAERRREISRNYQKRNPEKMRVIWRNRRARLRGAEGKHTNADIQEQYRSQRGRCWHCGKMLQDDWHVDHLIPLARGGTNNPNNLVISCPKCNMSKHDKLPQEWNGRLF